jgi:thiamine pyrophosphate-dependent acetolactate synthase large subunit-like protein
MTPHMVEFQEEMKYERSAGVDFGSVDFVKYAESFGAKGLRVTNQKELEDAIKKGYEIEGPVAPNDSAYFTKSTEPKSTPAERSYFISSWNSTILYLPSSVAGDGGFLFSSQDLETAVRKNLNIIQLIWNDGKYNISITSH